MISKDLFYQWILDHAVKQWEQDGIDVRPYLNRLFVEEWFDTLPKTLQAKIWYAWENNLPPPPSEAISDTEFETFLAGLWR